MIIKYRSTQPGHPYGVSKNKYQQKQENKQAIIPVSVVSKCKIVSIVALSKLRSAPSYRPMWLGKEHNIVYNKY